METNQVPSNPFEKIALSLSGGGYRAATFHLGSMAYLNHLRYMDEPLLEKVRLLSTVSGGTITGITYALLKQENRSFEYIYRFLLQKLLKLDLVATGIEMLNPDSKWDNESKNKNLINAFAEQYEQFTGGALLSSFDVMPSHLDTVLFNSTEFTNALNFRFRNVAAGYSGNYRIRIKKEEAREIKLSDVMASSSCFTGGFEPIIWPTDFAHKDAPVLMALCDTYKNEGKQVVGIMDGGIYDNQGIGSILNYKKGNNEPYFDLVIISDVASPYMKAYEPFVEKEKSGFRKLTVKVVMKKANQIDRWINYGICILILLSVTSAILAKSDVLSGIFIGLGIGFTLFFVLKLYLTGQIKAVVGTLSDNLLRRIPLFFRTKLSGLKIEELSVHRIEPLVIDRLNSLVSLLLSVFLKVVRRLNYSKLYEDERYTYRRISNLIQELTEKDFTEKRKNNETDESGPVLIEDSLLSGSYDLVVGEEIRKVAEEAASYGTTLWFTDQQKLDKTLDKLVASGQFTMCFNMMSYLEKLLYSPGNGFDSLSDLAKSQIKILYEQTKADFVEFKKDPMFMYKGETISLESGGPLSI